MDGSIVIKILRVSQSVIWLTAEDKVPSKATTKLLPDHLASHFDTNIRFLLSGRIPFENFTVIFKHLFACSLTFICNSLCCCICRHNFEMLGLLSDWLTASELQQTKYRLHYSLCEEICAVNAMTWREKALPFSDGRLCKCTEEWTKHTS